MTPDTAPDELPRTLGLFAKQPVLGAVKTRLAAESSPGWAAAVAEACLLDLVDRLAAVAARRILAFAPPEAAPYFADVVGGRFLLTPQAEDDLGRRMADFFTRQLAATAGPVVLLGADSPTVPLSFIEQAFAELAMADVVLGPATDGGYYLVGCARRVPPIFDGITWSSPHVLGETVACLASRERERPEETTSGRSRSRLAVLPPWYDVDTLADWWMLRGHLAALRRAGHDPRVPRLERLAGPGAG